MAVWAPGARGAAPPLWRFRQHTAAVKALAWSPHQAGLLASGGGTSDRHIRRARALLSPDLALLDVGGSYKQPTRHTA